MQELRTQLPDGIGLLDSLWQLHEILGAEFADVIPRSEFRGSNRHAKRERRKAMKVEPELREYMDAIQEQVCSRCIEKPPGGPPCAPLGKRCGIEINLGPLVEAVHSERSNLMDPYIQHFHDDVCAHCVNRPTNQCPCPLEYLLELAVEAIESVDERRAGEITLAGC